MDSSPTASQSIHNSTLPYYATGEHLRAKHARIRNQSGRTIERWALQLIPNDPTAHILDAGCGWGRFAWPLLESRPMPSTNLVCADASFGMLQSAVQEARERGHHPHFVTCGIEALPFPAQQFEGVMANFVLYHVEPLAQGVRELARVLTPDGWLLIAAHGKVQVPIVALHYQALDRLGISYTPEAPGSFDLDNGAMVLGNYFGQIERHEFVDEAIYPNAEAFTQSYLAIGRYRAVLARADVADRDKAALPQVFCELAKAITQPDGTIHAPVLMGAFVCTNPR